DEIVVSVQPLIAFVAKKYAANVSVEELVAETNARGAIQAAISAFDPNKAFRFGTFAKQPIAWAILAYLKQENQRLKTEPEHDQVELEEIVADCDDELDPEFFDAARDKLNEMLRPLTERERLIVESKYGLNGKSVCSFEQIGNKLGISRERVRQIESA